MKFIDSRSNLCYIAPLQGRPDVRRAPAAGQREFTLKITPAALFSFAALIFFCVFVYLAQEWRLQARLYPWAIGGPMVVLALVAGVLLGLMLRP